MEESSDAARWKSRHMAVPTRLYSQPYAHQNSTLPILQSRVSRTRPSSSTFIFLSPLCSPYLFPSFPLPLLFLSSPLLSIYSTCWSPFDDNLVASGGEDGKICIFKVSPADFANWSADDFEPKDWEPIAKMSAGGRKVGQLLFHPTASNVLASASGDHVVRLWDIEKPEEPVIVLEAHGDTIQDMVSLALLPLPQRLALYI
jgi:WD40 repeat protein